ncbi:MAG TPA: T3SS effector HopA1 family protein [Streptosporangiaceae bacterium]|nr:T3SS effector HopA1 family protein [Streptosporangiaceae bacterium]
MAVAESRCAAKTAQASEGDGLAPGLLAALAQVSVANDCRAGSVGDRDIEARSEAELAYRLSYAIYEVLHVGWTAEPAEQARLSHDDAFEARLLAATRHTSVVRTARVVSADAGHVTVELDGVRVQIPATEAGELPRDPGPVGSRIAVTLPSCRPALSPGYWVTDGTRALPARTPIVRLYVHLQTAGAVLAAWPAALEFLEAGGTPYRAKATSVPALLPRRDAIVVYVGEPDIAAATALGQRIGQVADVGESVSVFCEQLAAGVAMAWEPSDPRPAMRGLSFGEHRSRAVAEGLLRQARSAGEQTVAQAVRRALEEAAIDPGQPARNLGRR